MQTHKPLPFWKAAILGLGTMSIGMNLCLSPAYVHGFAGHGSLVSQIIGILTMLAIAATVSVYAKRHVATGSLMSYVYYAFGIKGRVYVAGSILCGYFVAMPSVTASTQIFMISAMNTIGIDGIASTVSHIIFAIAFLGMACFFTCRGADASVKVSALLGFICIPPILYVILVSAMREGVSIHQQLFLSDISIMGILQGAIVGMLFYVGFEGLSSFAGETQNPRRNVPLLLYMLILVPGAFAIFATILQVPVLEQSQPRLDAGVSPVAILADKANVSGFGLVLNLMLIPAGFVALVGTLNFSARVLATAARDKLLFSWLGQLHEPTFAPRRAAITLTILAIIALAVPQLLSRLSPVELGSYYGSMVVVFWIIPYFLSSIGAIIVEIRERELSIITLLAGSTGGCVMLALIVRTFLQPGEGFLFWMPYLMLVITISLAIWFYINAMRGNIGSDF